MINKFNSLKPNLKLNHSKSGTLQFGNTKLAKGETELMGIPIVESYKYLGIQIGSSTKSTLASMKNRISSNVGLFLQAAKRLPFESRKLILDSIIKGIILYQVIPFSKINVGNVALADRIYDNYMRRIMNLST